MKKLPIAKLAPLVIGIVGILVVTLVIPRAVKYVSRAGGVAANLVVDYEGVLGSMPRLWANLAQGGEESKPMLGNITNEVKLLRPEYIRIDHLYDGFGVVGGTSGQLTFDWSKLDAAVNEILATGAKPFLSLSYMPAAIAAGDVVSQPKIWNDWTQVVKATIEHYSGRSGMNLTKVIYECWNEPDLFGDYKTYGDKNYLTMYKGCSDGANAARNVNEFEIGGPAVTALYQNWLEKLIKFVDENNLRMDFLSWHRYDMDISRFEEDTTTAREWASGIPALINLKYYITEWGHDSKNHPGYDNKFGAIHTLAGNAAMVGKVGRAFIFEIKDGPGNEKEWGRWGMMTHEKFGAPEKKERFRAVEFLNTLGPFRLSLAGQGSWVRGIASTDEKGDIRLMVVNYDKDQKHGESVLVTFENLPSANFKYTRRDFLGGVAKSIQVATDSATWGTTEYFAPNSAAMISLEF